MGLSRWLGALGVRLARASINFLRPAPKLRRWSTHWLKRPTNSPRYRPVILVTGCGSGLGLALARELKHHAGYRTVITARQHSLRRLEEEFPQSDRFRVRELDVTNPTQREDLFREIEQDWGGVDILINNAGLSYRAVVEHMSDADELRQLSTNYLGPMALIRRALPYMRRRGRGKIINISSVSGMLAMPTMASYSASKHALEGASEALWHEMRPLGINVCLIQPGFINSDSFVRVEPTPEAAFAQTTPDVTRPYHDYYQNLAPFIETLMRLSPMTPESIARRILKVVRWQDPPLWISVTPDAWAFYQLRSLLPRRWLLPLLFFFLPKSDRWAEHYTQDRRRRRAA